MDKRIASQNKSGFTLIELIVSMGIFLIVLSMGVGAFTAITRLKAVSSNIRDSQQKMRVATDMINRYSRQADSIDVTSSPSQSVVLYFKPGAVGVSAIKYQVSGTVPNQDLRAYACSAYNGSFTTCTAWSTGVSLLSNNMKIGNTDNFSLSGAGKLVVLTTRLTGDINGTSGGVYSYPFDISLESPMDGL